MPALIDAAGLDITQEYTPEADYAYRISVGKTKAQHILTTLIADMEYTNFKDHLARNDRMNAHKRKTYGGVYYVACSLHDD